MLKNLIFTLLLWMATISLPAQNFTTLLSFNGANGAFPYGSLVQGTDGNFYGTTSEGGPGSEPGFGTVFKMTPDGALTTLYNFCSLANCADGEYPGHALVQASDGNFYGVTQGLLLNYGTVFKITPQGALTTIYTFCLAGIPFCTDGVYPQGTLLQASDGNLYGITGGGGSGTIFKMTLGGSLTNIYVFCAQEPCTDGSAPMGLIQGSDGNFYGTTFENGVNGFGTVFKITPGGTLTTLYNFCSQVNCTDGYSPEAGVIQASDGNFYGTTYEGGVNSDSNCTNDNGNCGDGTVFKLTPAGEFTVLHSFCSLAACADGSHTYAGLIQASDGSLYGNSVGGGANGDGIIFEVTTSGAWTTLYSFCAQTGCPDGTNPFGGLVQGTDGNLYGTTSDSAEPGNTGQDGGTVFRLALGSSTTSPAIAPTGGVVSGASFQAGIAANSWITIGGTNLSSKTDSWANAIVNGALPTSLDGISVSVGGKAAYISYVSPTQINAIAPNVVPGPVQVTVTIGGVTSVPVTTTAQAVQPAFFQWGTYAVATTQNYALAVKSGTFSGVTTVPAKPGDVIILWGTGFGPTTPAAPVGAEVASGTTLNTANAVTVTVGGSHATVYGAALAPGFAGLYQVGIQIPPSLSDGDYPVVATINGASSPATTLITIAK